MNKKDKTLLLGLLFIPAGAVLLNACGPQEEDMMNKELALETAASDNVILATDGLNPLAYYTGAVNFSEYGRCKDAWDNNGNGLVDMEDPDCHLIGPLRDLSLYPAPVGHNFIPDITQVPPSSPGAFGGFRDRQQITKWFRFLTESDGNIAGTKPFGPGVNPAVVPIPAPLPVKIRQGTWAHGNNNNIDPRMLYDAYPGIPLIKPYVNGATQTEFVPPYPTTEGRPGMWPGAFYKGGSQGFLNRMKTGNPDGGGRASTNP